MTGVQTCALPILINLFSTLVKDFFKSSSETEIKGIFSNSVLTLDFFCEKGYNIQVVILYKFGQKKSNTFVAFALFFETQYENFTHFRLAYR